MDLLQPLMTVGLVMALLGGTLVLLKKRGVALFHLPRLSSPATRRMEIMERLSLGPHHSLQLIRLDERSILVATAPTSLQVLGEIGGAAIR